MQWNSLQTQKKIRIAGKGRGKQHYIKPKNPDNQRINRV